jgi:FkbM family methyltransferase
MNDFMSSQDIIKRNEYFCNGVSNENDAEYFMQYLFTFLVRKGDVVIDVGANKGLHTIPLAETVGENGLVYAFEAIPSNVENLKRLTKDMPVRVIHGAVTNAKVKAEKSQVTFCHVQKYDGFSGIIRRPNVEESWDPIEITVPTITIDSMIDLSANVTFIKSDVECGDFDVMRGAVNLLKKSKPVIIFESGRQYAADMYGYTMEEFFNFFDEIHYELFTFAGEPFTRETWTFNHNFWETWAVHKDSNHISFFRNNLKQLVQRYVDRHSKPTLVNQK